ncbi:MAG: glycosyltransferase [Luteitalea sp.]|nr:glycosyltransferase [Luteitalea sp.]
MSPASLVGCMRRQCDMRVAIFTDNNFDWVSGVTTTLQAVLRWRPADIDIRIYTAADAAVTLPDYLALRSLGTGIPFYREMKMFVPRFFAFLRHAKADDLDLIHYTTPGPVGLAAIFVRWRLKLPMIGSFHTQLSEYTELLSGSRWLGRLMREYQRWPYGKCEQVLAPSEATRALLVAAHMRPEKIRIWTRGVDTERFAPTRRSAAMREAWGVTDERPVLLYAGRLSAEKGLDVVPAVTRALRAARINHQFVFVGDGPMRQALQAACPDAVFTAALPHEQVASAMASADMFVFPSRTDTLGNVVLEAQASGLPVLVSNEGGPRENMIADETGFVCAAERPTDLISRAVHLAREAALRMAMGQAARAYALERSWARALAPLYQAYRDVAARRASSAAAAAMFAAPAPKG